MNLEAADAEWIVTLETGGLLEYNPRPEVPPALSGVTIGVGYDLGQVSAATFAADWGGYLAVQDYMRLKAVVGLQGGDAQARLKGLLDIKIPWAIAREQFAAHTLPVHTARTLSIYPQAAQLPSRQAAVLVSLVFNRGPALAGDRRLEMRQIQQAMVDNALEKVPGYLRAMKRLWPTVPGLQNRREAEAKRWETA